MPIYGDLDTMPLTDVLQWLGVALKTGVLEVERGSVRKRVELNKGLVAACQTTDRGSQLGPMLIACGMITEAQLEQAVVQQQLTGGRLGFLLVEQGALNEQEARRMLTVHIEQTIQGMFEWDAAVFRFYEGATFDTVCVEVGLPINDMLLRTLQHQDELEQIRQVFASSGIVLRPTATPVPDELADSEMSRKIFESIDGRRTIGEVVVQARASEVLVLKLLHRLLSMELVECVETRPVPSGTATLLDPLVLPEEPHAANFELQRLGIRPESLATGQAAASRALAGLQVELDAARLLIDRGEHAVAGELLQATSRAHPRESRIAGLREEVERACFPQGASGRLPPSHIPVRAGGAPEEGRLDSDESFLLSLIDGESDVRSIVSLASLREVEVLGTLELLLDKGCISLRAPVPAEA